MRLTCQALIFDLDGVLVDSKAVIEKHWRKWAELQQLDPDHILRIAHGRRTAETIAAVAPHLDANLEAEKMELYEAPDTEGLLTYDRAGDLLKSLPDGSWAIATSGRKNTALTRLKFANLPVPRILITAEDIKNGKPDPEVYLLAATRLNIAHSKCIVIEDSPAGTEAATGAGMRVVAVTTTHSASQLHGAAVLLPTIEALTIEVEKKDLILNFPGT